MKTNQIVVLALAVAALALTTLHAFAAPALIAGDINGDDKRDIGDAIVCLKVLAGAPAAGLRLDADPTQNSRIELADVLWILGREAAETVRSGVFLDNAVAGLNYSTITQSGVTDENGAFRYLLGETVTFSIGGSVLGHARGASIVTPLDLAPGAADETDPRVTRICRLLQGLDKDCDLGNGIRVPERAGQLMGTWSVDVAAEDDVFQEAVQGLLADLGREGIFPKAPTLPGVEQARNHFRHTLATAVHPIDASDKPSDFASANADTWQYAMLENVDVPVNSDVAGADQEVAREIEEADIVKIDGNRLFILNRYRGLILCDVSNPDQPAIKGRLPFAGEPIDMYVRNNRVYALARFYGDPVYGLAVPEATDADIAPPPQDVLSRVYVADVSDPTNPVLAGSFDLTGDIIDSRIVGDILYVVFSETFWRYGFVDDTLEASADDPTTEGPTVYVASYNVSDPNDIQEVDREQFNGSARHIHVTETAVFVAGVETSAWNGNTRITYIDIADPNGAIRRRGDIVVPGQMADEFKMDFYNEHLRAVTYQWTNDGGISLLNVIDAADPDALKIVGDVQLGKGEQLFATRFDGDRGYLVTYERKDPLWVLDLSDPANPKIKGELIVPGWSTHIEPLGDRLAALGVDDTDGWRVAVSLFNVSDPANPTLIKRLSFGEENGWSSTAGYRDVKAFTVLEDLGLIILPYSTGGYIDGVYQTDHRLQLIDYAPDDIAARGWVSQEGDVLRGRMFQDRLFSVSSNELQVIDAADRDHPKVTATLPLAANIADFIPIDNGFGVQGVSEAGAGYRLQSVSLDNPDSLLPVGSLSLEDASISGLFGNSNLIYLMESRYEVYPASTTDEKVDNSWVTRVTVFDFEDPEKPVQRGSLEIPGTNVQAVPMMADAAVHPYYWGDNLIQVKPDVMVLVRGGDYYWAYADKGQTTGPQLTVLDLSDPDAPAEVANIDVQAPGATAWFARNNILYFSYPGEKQTDAANRTIVRNYLGRVDLTDPDNPMVLPPINIPGTCAGMEGFGPYIFTIDRQWTADGSLKTAFNSLKLEDDKARLLDSIEISTMNNNAIISNGRAWLSGASYWWSGGGLKIIDLSDPENLVAFDHELKGRYPRVIGARGTKAFVNFSGGTACYDASNPENLKLDSFKNHYAWPDQVRFMDDMAYLALGYYGVWVKDL